MIDDNERQKLDKEVKGELNSLASSFVDDAMKGELDTAAWLKGTTDITIGSVYSAAQIGLTSSYTIVAVDDFAEYWLNASYEGMTLSERLRDSAKDAKKIVESTLREHIKAKTTVKRITDSLTAQKVSSGDLPQYLKDLEAAVKDYALSPEATRQQRRNLERALARAAENIEKLAQNGAPTQQLKRAYQRVLNAAVMGDADLLREKMQHAVEKKAIYNNQRIARTESARAYFQGVGRRAEDMGAEFIQWNLSSRHKIADQCDVYANANAYGKGRGVWRIKGAPVTPAHPFCMCTCDPVAMHIDDNRTVRYSKERVAEELDRLPLYKQRMIVGEDGELITEDIRGYDAPNKMKPLAKKLIV